MYMETKEITLLEKQVMPLVAQAESTEIKSAEDMKTATTVLSDLNRYIDTLVAKREEITAPLNLALKNARAMFDPIEKPAKAAKDELRSKIAEYQTEQMRIAEEEEEKIAARVKAGKGNLSAETAIKKMEGIERPDRKVETESGSLNFRPTKKLKITDALLIPRHYLVVDEKLLLEDLKKGVAVYGATLETVMVPINYR